MTTIFYIEDSPVERQLIKRILAPHYTVVLAGDGLEAAQQGKHLKPDLVLTDLNMPGLDGYELATKLKAAWPDVPIVGGWP
ncbi:MAG: PleD family two-component system response regulator [Anaerolineae bacterium]